MRILLLMMLAIPGFLNAQINRSAKELASERTREYLVNKLFRNDAYKPVSYGELKAWNDTRSPISWTFEHVFEIKHTNKAGFEKPQELTTTYSFLFYLDRQMKILKAESFSRN
jgi:hypothetical protein